MKHSLLFWSRKSHCWAGVYLSAVTLLWLGEMALLPAVYEPRFEVASPSPAVSSVGTPAVSVQDVLDRFSHERVDGEPLTPDTVTFLPKEGSWVVRDAGRYVSVKSILHIYQTNQLKYHLYHLHLVQHLLVLLGLMSMPSLLHKSFL